MIEKTIKMKAWKVIVRELKSYDIEKLKFDFSESYREYYYTSLEKAIDYVYGDGRGVVCVTFSHDNPPKNEVIERINQGGYDCCAFVQKESTFCFVGTPAIHYYVSKIEIK